MAHVVTFNTSQDIGFPANMHGTSPIVRDYIQNTFEVTYYPDEHMVRPQNPRFTVSLGIPLHPTQLPFSQVGSRKSIRVSSRL